MKTNIKDWIMICLFTWGILMILMILASLVVIAL